MSVPVVTHDDSFVYVNVGGKTVKLKPQEAKDLAEALERDADVIGVQP